MLCKICEEYETKDDVCDNCRENMKEKKLMVRNDRNITIRQIFTFEGINYLLEVGWDIVHDPQNKLRPHLVQTIDLTVTERRYKK